MAKSTSSSAASGSSWARAKCPVLPIAIEGAFPAFPRGQKLPGLWSQRIAVGVGEPISHERLLAMGPEKGLPYLQSVIEAQRQDLRHELAAARSNSTLNQVPSAFATGQ